MTTADKDTSRRAKTDFVDAICAFESDLFGVATVLICADFERLIAENASALHLFGSRPYYICLQMVLAGAIKKLKDDNGPDAGKHKLKPIFDSSEELGGETAQTLYRTFLAKNPNFATMLLALSYENDTMTPALQVSDLLAYEVRKYVLGRFFDNRQTRVAYERLLPTIYRIDKLDYENLNSILGDQATRL